MAPYGGGGFDRGGGRFGRGSYGGRGGGGFSGGRGGRGFSGGRGGGGFRDRGSRGFDDANPDEVVFFGKFSHTAQNDIVCKVDHKDVPYFNAPLYFESKQMIGKIDEIFGSLTEYYVSVKLESGVNASSFSSGKELYINPMKLLPMHRFLPSDNKGRGGRGGRGRGGGGRGGRGGRGGFGGGGRFRGGGGGGGRFGGGGGGGGRFGGGGGGRFGGGGGGGGGRGFRR